MTIGPDVTQSDSKAGVYFFHFGCNLPQFHYISINSTQNGSVLQMKKEITCFAVALCHIRPNRHRARVRFHNAFAYRDQRLNTVGLATKPQANNF